MDTTCATPISDGNTLIFGDTRISLQHSGRKLPYQNQLDSFSRFDTTPVCDRRTDTWRQHILRYCIEWHSEGVFVTICHYTKTRRHPQNWKFMTYCSTATGVPSHGNGHCKKLWEFWRSGWYRGLCLQRTYRLRDRDIIQTCYSIVFLTTSVLKAI